MTGNRHIVLAAGGTGGHMVPAHVLAQELAARGYQVSLITDERGQAFPGLFPGVPKHLVPAATLVLSRPGTWISGLRTLIEGREAAGRLLDIYKPAAVIGFGGYPSLPAVWAATRRGVPTALHEQNAVLGRVNRFFAGKVQAIATSFAETRRVPAAARDRLVVTGNPVRADILALRDQPFPDFEDDDVFRVLVIGGSQGAKVLSDVVPGALAMLPTALKARLQVTQQCRSEDLAGVRALYAGEGIAADLATFIEDMATQLRWAHLVIARAGASTLSELTVAGRPAILVPLPGATDDHQTANCAALVAAGGARMIRQSQFTSAELAKQIQKLALTPQGLVNAAARARSVGTPEAPARLGDLVDQLVGRVGMAAGARAMGQAA
jgi:UDP-N-acetylglucosamine--N-acetylmuramyl-(pentapeptide) pyrophosphoryl-undecaprenol N-acetylglucosamine transferase